MQASSATMQPAIDPDIAPPAFAPTIAIRRTYLKLGTVLWSREGSFA
jgi:hypothetical protein